MDEHQQRIAPETDVSDLVIENDTGARFPSGLAGRVIFMVALLWALFQLWIASPLQFSVSYLSFDDTAARAIHLAFALFLAFAVYPAFPRSSRNKIPLADWLLGLAGAFCAAYLYLFAAEISKRPGLPTTLDIAVTIAGIVLVLEAVRRAMGMPMVIIAGTFIAYTFLSDASWMPDIFANKSVSLNRFATHQWLSQEGVFGIALGVSVGFVYLFVLFGSLLEKGGAGNYFILLAFSLLGHLRGGPAKAAVLASAFNGMIAGSAIANVVMTGTFTIPLMKRVGFSSEKAGAIETAASCDGQIMPPVMGAAAFIMVEYVGIPFRQLVMHTFLPALLSYIGLLYIVHLEAVKAEMASLEKPIIRRFRHTLLIYGITISSLLILAGVVFYGIEFLKQLTGGAAPYLIGSLLVVGYVMTLRYVAAHPDLEQDDPNSPVVKMPRTLHVFRSGVHYMLPIVVLLWCLMVEGMQPAGAVFWAILAITIILITQRPLIAWFRGKKSLSRHFRKGVSELRRGLVIGSRNMIGIAVATAAAGIIVGTISLTGLGQSMVGIVEALSGGSLIMMLLLTALISVILGMGMPTTATYVIVASLMVGVIQELGRKYGLIVPPIAIHLFVFYFGIMADITPPVGIASYAAAAISRGDPIRTGIQAFVYAIRTAILPFFFIFNTKLLLIDVHGFWDGLYNFLVALLAMMLFTAGLQGYFFARSKWYESILLLLLSSVLFVPSYWMDTLYPRYQPEDPAALEQLFAKAELGDRVRLYLSGEDRFGDPRSYYAHIYVPEGKDGWERIEHSGLSIAMEEGRVIVDDVTPGSPAEGSDIVPGDMIEKVFSQAPRPAKEWMFVPVALLLGSIILLQHSRKRRARVSSVRRLHYV